MKTAKLLIKEALKEPYHKVAASAYLKYGEIGAYIWLSKMVDKGKFSEAIACKIFVHINGLAKVLR